MMKINKQFKDFLDEYTTSQLFLDLIDQASEEQVIDHFYYRYVTDDNRFVNYFTRNLKRVSEQYYTIQRIESINFDPMVTKYLEEEEIRRTTKTIGGTDTTSETTGENIQNSGIITVKVDNETTDTINGEVSTSGQGSTSNSGSTTGTNDYTNTDTIRTRELLSNMPHSDVSSATTGGLMANVNWRYASNMQDNGEDSTHVHDEDTTSTTSETGTSSNSETSTSESTGSTVLDGTQITTRGDGQTRSGSKSITKSKTGNDSEDATNHKIYTGRDGIPADLLDKARSYVRKSNAIEWLFDELEICFMPNLLYGEDI